MAVRTRDRYRPVKATPPLGGALITRGSKDNAGTFNYVTKRDWRRDLDQEIRREGHDYFYPNLTLPVGGQPFPSQIQLDGLTYAAGTVTATRLSGQWFQVGETVIVTGANDPIYNGSHTVTAVLINPPRFQYAVSGVPVSPDTSTAIFAQADEEINLLALARRPNGQTAVIAGSQHRLYRYYALEDPDYISHDPDDYPAGTATDQLSYWSDGVLYPADQMPPRPPGFWTPPGLPVSQMEYVDENPGYWIVIGSGYSDLGHRWETVSINGYMVFNNGIDLPVTYRVEELSVVPIYELRDNGIARINTISEINGILMGGDITEIQPNKVGEWFRTAGRIQIDSLAFAAGVVTATRAAGIPYTVGQSITISGAVHDEYNGVHVVLSVGATTFTYGITGTPASPDPSSFIYSVVTNGDAPYGVYPYDQYLTRTIFRVIWGVPGEPRRWGEIALGLMDANSNVLTLGHAVKGFTVGMNVTVVGAGPSHAGGTADNLTGNILSVSGETLVLDSFASTTVFATPVQATDMIGSIVGFEDLQDDGSGILKMLPLADQLVIYKDTSIFLAQYLGDPTQPFAFAPRRVQKEQSLYYRHTLLLAETPTEMFHIYAGRNAFYRFDLTSQQPMILPHFESCSNIFFDQATLANTERIFAAENGITHEILFVYPITKPLVNVGDNLLAWDYKWNTLSTSSAEITAACTVRKPLTGLASGAEQDWFIMGTAHGAVLLYGLTNEPNDQPGWDGLEQIFYRRGENPEDDTKGPYDSILTSGYGGFGHDYGEKDCRAFLPLMASQDPPSADYPAQTPLLVEIFGAQNANLPPTLIATKLLTDPQTQNLVPLMVRRFYLQSRLTIPGADNFQPARLAGSLWDVAIVDSRSLSRGA